MDLVSNLNPLSISEGLSWCMVDVLNATGSAWLALADKNSFSLIGFTFIKYGFSFFDLALH